MRRVSGRRSLPDVVFLPVPEPPDANLALGERAYASSTHTNVRLCGGVDGNTDSAQWGASGTHDATSGVYPDTYGVDLAQTTTVGRVELYTLDSERYPAAVMGVRDFDIQVHAEEGWQTVKESGETKSATSAPPSNPSRPTAFGS